MGVGAGLYMCDVVVKSSRSLSHLLMSSCMDLRALGKYRNVSDLHATGCRHARCLMRSRKKHSKKLQIVMEKFKKRDRNKNV